MTYLDNNTDSNYDTLAWDSLEVLRCVFEYNNIMSNYNAKQFNC